MNKILTSGVACLLVLAGVAATSSAGHHAGGLVPGCNPVTVAECGVPLYRNVRYRDERRVHPCAVPMVVMVQDPCWRDDKCDPCDQPRCVAVQICVPPCSVCPPRVTCNRNGTHVRYDYGKYAVDIRSHRNGCVTVDYDGCK